MAYENPLTMLYRFPAASVASAAVVGRIVGPAGKKGVVVSVGSVVTTGVTDAAGTVKIGSATDDDAYGVHTMPVSSANAVANSFTPVFNHEAPADAVILVTAGGEPTAGAGDLLVGVNWY